MKSRTSRHLDRYHTQHAKPLNKRDRAMLRLLFGDGDLGSRELEEIFFSGLSCGWRKAAKRRGSCAADARAIRAALKELREYRSKR